MFDLLLDGGWLFYIALGLGIALFLMFILFSVGVFKDATAYHGVGFFVLAVFVTLIASTMTNLLTWILVGITFSSWAGILFVVGVLVFLFGMISSYVKEGNLVS